MERHAKERLVGAAVLMAAAIILIPEMLSGPERSEAERSDTEQIALEASTPVDGPIKTYTIDLDASRGSASAPTATEEPAPPPERTGLPTTEQADSAAAKAALPDQAKPESASTSTARVNEAAASQVTEAPVPEAAARRSPTSAQSTSAQPAAQSTTPAQGSARPLATQPIVPTSRGWAVQLGSFSNRSTAEQLAQEFRAERYDTFVMPVKTATATFYRVRIGPMQDRASAEDMLRVVKAKVAGAAVVIHP